MARRRFFVDQVRKGHAAVTGEQAQHLRRVLRVEVGQRFEISDNTAVYLAEVEGFGKDLVDFRVLEQIAQPVFPVRLHLLVSLIKFDRMEWMIEKATELGVERITPVHTERSEKGLERGAGKRLERWRRIAFESSQQSRRERLPAVDSCIEFPRAVNVPADYRYLLDEAGGTEPFLRQLPVPAKRLPGASVAILLGPEGGWTDAEREKAVLSGWLPVSLGPLILRAETAAASALAIAGNAWLAASGAAGVA